MERSDIRLALPSKGRLYDDSLEFLARCGLEVYRPNPRQYVATIPSLPGLTVILQRPGDIVTSVRQGSADFGITGLDVLGEKNGAADGPVLTLHDELGIAKCRLMLAVPNEWDSVRSLSDLVRWAATQPEPLRVAYHAACSLQHGQQIRSAPKDLLKTMGFEVIEPADSHLCCGSAGTYNLLQPRISAELKHRKVATLQAMAPDVIAAGNLGCMMQIGSGTDIRVVHTVELIDWATGGPKPRVLQA